MRTPPVQCSVMACYREEGVDFCFQCKDYPCEKGLSGPIGERWKKMNDRMQEIGVEAYYDEQAKTTQVLIKSRCHYTDNPLSVSNALFIRIWNLKGGRRVRNRWPKKERVSDLGRNIQAGIALDI